MRTLILQHVVDHDRAFEVELAKLRAPTADEVATARRQALADVIERAREAYRARGAR